MKLVTLHRKIKWLSKYGITPSQEKLCSPNYTILQDFKAHQFSWKTHISYPTCVYYGVTNVHFSENLGALFCCNTCLEICPFLSCFRRIYSFETNLGGTKNFNLAQLVCVVHFYIDWFYRFESGINSAPPHPLPSATKVIIFSGKWHNQHDSFAISQWVYKMKFQLHPYLRKFQSFQ